MKSLLKSLIIGLLLVAPLATHAQSSSLWKYTSSLLQPVVSTWNVYAPANFRFDGEIQPDGSTCADGEILKKTGANNWDCAADNTGSGGGLSTTTPWTAGDLAQVVDNGTVKSIATSSLGLITTNVAEGSNLYYTLLRWASALAGTTTDALAEGGINKYYTSSRFNTDFSTKSTTDLAEGTNLYYTVLRWASAMAGTTTDALAEGSTNQYWTIARFRTALLGGENAILGNATSTNATTTNQYVSNELKVGALSGLLKATSGVVSVATAGVDYVADVTGDWTGTFDGQQGTYYLDRANHTGTQLAATISDFASTARALLSGTSPITYDSGTGAIGLNASAITTLSGVTSIGSAGATTTVLGGLDVQQGLAAHIYVESTGPITTPQIIATSTTLRSSLQGVDMTYASTTALTNSGLMVVGNNGTHSNEKLFVGGTVVSVTPSTVSDLVINDSSSASLQLLGANTSVQYLLFGDINDNDVGAISYDHSNNSMAFAANTGVDLTIDSSGNVGVASTTPWKKFSVLGELAVGGPSGNNSIYMTNTGTGGRLWRFIFSLGADTLAGGFGLFDSTAGAYRWVVSPAGNFGIGTTTPNYRLALKAAANSLFAMEDNQSKEGFVSSGIGLFSRTQATAASQCFVENGETAVCNLTSFVASDVVNDFWISWTLTENGSGNICNLFIATTAVASTGITGGLNYDLSDGAGGCSENSSGTRYCRLAGMGAMTRGTTYYINGYCEAGGSVSDDIEITSITIKRN